MSPKTAIVVVTLLYLLRAAVTYAHGHAHDQLAVPLAAWQHAFVWIVIVIAPTAAVVLLWFWRSAWVAWLLAALMISSWLFGLYFHFGPPNPDHVASQPDMPGRALFAQSAVALAIVDPLVALAAVWLARVIGKSGGRHRA